MASTFDTKFDAILDKVPLSVMNSPWKRVLFWVVFLIGAIAALLLFFIFGVLKEVFDGDESTSPVGDQRTQAEIDAAAWNDELGMIHQHYEMNEFGTIQGPKDPEW